MPEMGGFKAAEIHIWLREVEQPPQPADPALQLGRAAESQPPEWSGRSPNLPETEVLPDRMLAKGNVEIDTTRLVGDAQQLQAWFRYEPVAPNYEAGPTRAPAARPVNLQATHYQLPHAPPPPNAFSADQQRMTDRAAPPGANHRPISGHAPPTQPFDRGLGQQALPPGQPVSSEPPPKRFEMHGKLIQVQLLRRGEEDPELETATIEGQAVLRGLTAGAPQEPPLDVRGDKLHMTGGEANAVVHVFGKPATVAARGLTMNAANIHLDRPGNRLWIDGPGMMTLPPKAAQSLGGAGSSPGAPIHVTWQERMEFDGNTVHFERDVRTRSRQPGERGAWTDLATYGDVLDASVSRFVDFSADEQDFKDDKVELRRLVYDGGVFVEAHGFDPRGQREAWDRMQIPNLTLDQLTGEITSRGAGWIQSVRLGGGDLLAGGPLSAPTRPAAPSDSGKRELTYTRVDYQQGIGGNLHNREVVFRDQVQTVHGPVPVWDAVLYADRPDGLGEKGVVIHCDELSLYEMGPWVTSRRKAVELVAAGNAVVEGRTFNAHANRLKYAEAKDLVVLEGDGRRDAELWRQEQIGGARSHAAARQIWFWRGENRIEVDDARFIDLTQLGARP
jgi:hypothetical protein